ncbi:MAG: enoyl-CoA hydratase-related protein, partial [Pseudomonadota bacterium]
AMGLSLLADPLPASTAADWGLIWEVVEDDRLATRAQELALRLAEGPTRAYRAMKAALRASPGHGFEEQLALEAAQQQALTRTRDYREGVLAFLEKRKPDFEGR